MLCGVVVVFFFFPFLIGKKLCSVCLVTELCQRRVRAEVSCLVLVLVTAASLTVALELLKRCVLEILTSFPAHQAYFAMHMFPR